MNNLLVGTVRPPEQRLRELRSIWPEIILQIYSGAMTEWPLRKLIPGSMLQQQHKSREQQNICAISPTKMSQELVHTMGCDNFTQALIK